MFAKSNMLQTFFGAHAGLRVPVHATVHCDNAPVSLTCILHADVHVSILYGFSLYRAELTFTNVTQPQAVKRAMCMYESAASKSPCTTSPMLVCENRQGAGCRP